MRENFMITKSIWFCFSLILFNHLWNVNATEFEERENDDFEFIDLGIRLTGAKRDPLIADLIAEEREFINAGHVDGIELYHLHLHQKRNRRSKRSIDELVEVLKQDERIEYVVIGEKLERQKRDFLDENFLKKFYKKLEQTKFDEKIKYYDDTHVDHSKFQMGFNDLLYTKQWYLENKGQFDIPTNHDANLPPAWLAGYSGRGVVINIVDDGLDHSHPELSNRYRPDLSYDLNDLNDTEHDPMPSSFDGKNSHGTYCAGAAVAEANNGLCGVGPAFGADIAGIRLLDGRVTTLTEARSIAMFAPHVDIMSASWGPLDDGTRMESPGALITSALNYAVTQGRRGKGTVIVFAAGNGGIQEDHCGADGYASHYNVISIGTINHLGQTTYFDERCASTMAVTYTGGPHKPYSNEKILPIAVVTSDVQNKCKTDFYGTSGAAPVAAGIFALALEANPELTYRDLMHIIAQTSRIPNLEETNDWFINGAGYHVSHKFGFGTLDAGQMVAAAQNWTNVPSRSECYYEHKSFTRQLDIGTVEEVSIDIRECLHVTNLEHVVANVSFIFHRRGDVKITLISPSGTPSEMLDYRPRDATSKGIQYFPYTSVHHWDESPIGIWTLRMETRQPQDKKSRSSAMNYDGRSELNHFGLRLYGSNKIDNNGNRNKRNTHTAFVPNAEQLEMLYKRELALRETPNIMQKRDYDLLAKKRTQNISEGGFLSFLRRIFTL